MGNLGCCNQSKVIVEEIKLENLPIPSSRREFKSSVADTAAKRLPQEALRSITSQENKDELFEPNSFEFSLNNAADHINFQPEDLRKNTEISEGYTIVSQIGSSCYGNSYKAIHKASNTFRAIGIINKRRLKSDTLTSITNEIKILQSIDSLYLSKIYEIIEDESQINVCTNLCIGSSLYEKISNDRDIKENNIAEYIYQIVSALQICHNQNIINGNLDPEYILFTDDKYNAKLNITNFCFSNLLDKKFPLSLITDSIYYAAPEILEGHITSKSDIWSCGVILYTLLCSYAPFIGFDDEKIAESISKGSFNFSGKE